MALRLDPSPAARTWAGTPSSVTAVNTRRCLSLRSSSTARRSAAANSSHPPRCWGWSPRRPGSRSQPLSSACCAVAPSRRAPALAAAAATAATAYLAAQVVNRLSPWIAPRSAVIARSASAAARPARPSGSGTPGRSDPLLRATSRRATRSIRSCRRARAWSHSAPGDRNASIHACDPRSGLLPVFSVRSPADMTDLLRCLPAPPGLAQYACRPWQPAGSAMPGRRVTTAFRP